MPRKWLLRPTNKKNKAVKMESSTCMSTSTSCSKLKASVVIIDKKLKPTSFPPAGYRPTVLNTLLAVSLQFLHIFYLLSPIGMLSSIKK